MRPVDMLFPPEFRVEPHSVGCQVSRRMGFTQERRTMVLPVEPELVQAWIDHPSGLIQDVFPGLSVDQREFLLSGMTPEDWERAFG